MNIDLKDLSDFELIEIKQTILRTVDPHNDGAHHTSLGRRESLRQGMRDHTGLSERVIEWVLS